MNEKYMRAALKEAQKAYDIEEVPIGAVIVKDGKIIARAHNQKETSCQATAHAEILAIQKACKKLKAWRLEDCDMYVTLEPCPMCSGAIINSRIKNLYFGAMDLKSGTAGSKFNMFEDYTFNHKVNITSGLLENECSNLLSNFFKMIRKKHIDNKKDN